MKVVLEDMFGVVESRKWVIPESQDRVWEGIKFKEKPIRQEIHGIPTTIGNGDYSTFEKPMDLVDCCGKEFEENNQSFLCGQLWKGDKLKLCADCQIIKQKAEIVY